jgi:hypothetical protein
VPVTAALRTTRRVTAAALPVAIAAAAGLAAAACGAPDVVGSASASQPAMAAGASSPAKASPSAGQPLAPLTGLPASSALAAARPAVALVLAGDHLRGLTSADVVFEEITSPIRYIAVFQSREATAVGPVTSTRPTDGQVLSVLRAAVGYAGGTAGFIDVLDATKIVDMGYAARSSLYQQSSAGLVASTQAFERAAHSAAPPPLFPYRGEGIGTGHTLATAGVWRPSSVRVHLPGLGTQRWQFDSRTDRWVQVSGGPRVSVANLVVQMVPYKEVFLSHKEGLTVPSARVIGTGRAVVATGLAGTADTGSRGLAADATWSKLTLGDVTNYLDKNGFAMNFAPGPTWIILAPPGTRVSSS